MTTTESTTTDQVAHVKEQAEAFFHRAKERLKPVDDWIRTTARERPVLLLAGAFGIGYLVARLLRRR
jgi:ABC-type hemin transport system substrate-binding protein